MKKFFIQKYLDLIGMCANSMKSDPQYELVINTLLETLHNGGTVFTMGCGGSASTATHFAADLAKTTITPASRRFKVMSLVDNIPLVSAWTNDEGWGSVFSGQLQPWLTEKDVLVGFSVHGGDGQGNAGPWSQNLVAAMNLALERKAKIIGFSGFDGGYMKRVADACMVVPVLFEDYGTPLVEAMHVVLHHGIIFDLKERLKHE